MANEVREVETGARINHPVYRDVYNTTFDKDVIVDFEIVDGLPSGMCQTEKYGWLPVFYHCKKHCYDESIRDLQENKSLKGGVLAFEVDDEVKVLIEEGTPKCVIGPFKQYSPPRMCKDIIRISGNSGLYEHYFVVSVGKALENDKDYYGDTPLCEHEATVFYDGFVADETGWWASRYFFLKLWQILYIFISDVNYDYEDGFFWWPPAPCRALSAGIWTQEKEDILIASGLSIPWSDPASYYVGNYIAVSDLDDLTDAIVEAFALVAPPYGGGTLDGRTLEIYGQSDEEE